MSGSTPSTSGISSIFKKPAKATDAVKDATAEVPQVPVERVVASPRRQVGRGRRDTVLTGADGLSGV